MLLIRRLAETNRTPFDLTERESELVSGFNVEYSATLFTLLFLAEYTNILLMRALIRIILEGSGNSIKALFINFNIKCLFRSEGQWFLYSMVG